ncbi:MAG: gluconate 2-dehydrogenase subunit 3 family protein [Gammaproteobacteria bacterium]|nr:gluconate 2-dehydrogenase subunit 3 family protein [Gammaproteobacteria bacterium]MCW9004736.1 gluconate 2-dehydrogenase subunit 3 family protein [Gammaproteobacteria bacterium]
MNNRMNRRTFIRLIASITAAYPASALLSRRAHALSISNITIDEPWHTLAVVQEHLFPATEDSPGAADIQARIFLQNMLNAPDTDNDEKEFISNGVSWLNDISTKNYKKSFIELNESDKEKVLRQIEQSQAGERWLSLLLTYLIEALLSDPVYGGNPDGVGWKWLQHQPGFPRPSVDKMYYKLGKPKYTRTKA